MYIYTYINLIKYTYTCRPSDSIIKEANLIAQFKANDIVAIFNLTEPGEHPFCGIYLYIYTYMYEYVYAFTYINV
jgi:hypothetical protein